MHNSVCVNTCTLLDLSYVHKCIDACRASFIHNLMSSVKIIIGCRINPMEVHTYVLILKFILMGRFYQYHTQPMHLYVLLLKWCKILTGKNIGKLLSILQNCTIQNFLQ